MTEEIAKSVMGATSEDVVPPVASENDNGSVPDKSLGTLQKEAIALGFSAEAAEKIKSKPVMQAVIDSLSNKVVQPGEIKAVEKVATIDEKPNPREEKQIDRILNSRKGIIFRKLEAQPQVPIFIAKPEDQPEGVVKTFMKRGIKEYIHVSGSVEKFIINGYKIIVPRGVQFTVPKQVYDMWAESQMLTQRAGQEFSASRIDPRTGQPFSNRL